VSVIVQKYGGSSVADVDRIRRVADRVATTRAAGNDVVVVVSAMGDTTDELLALARQVSSNPASRELDMLLSAGERISMTLLSMALNDRGVPAVSFTGSQSGIMTSDAHTNARIVEVRPFRVQDELARGKVVIVAGYQGVSYKREVTTLGRGGSDTTAVALAAALDAEACEIYSDVEGVYTADPRVVPEAQRIAEISYEEMQELAEAGARVLNAQAVEFAKDRGIAIYARSSFGGDGETIVRIVRRHAPRLPGRVAGVTSQRGLVLLSSTEGAPDSLSRLLERLDSLELPGKQLQFRADEKAPAAVSLVLSADGLPPLSDLRDALGSEPRLREGVAAVSAIGAAINADFGNVRRCLDELAAMGVEALGLSTTSFRISVLLDESHLAEAVRRLHHALVVETEPVRSLDA
jgi:aspartate kinase